MNTGLLQLIEQARSGDAETFLKLVRALRADAVKAGILLLFDEIEKAHPNVFDLCLQVFDAGRLTDKLGRTTDFRRSIIILTSNIGSAISREAPVGFRANPASPGVTTPGLSPDATLRELGRWFRPEFLNRLDRIVTFRPLGAEIAEKIARREVGRVLERSGLARRKLTVDVEPAVVSLLGHLDVFLAAAE